MFHPEEHPMVRGWVGRIEDSHVVHLAAQTLQAFLTGGGTAREHAVYPLAEVRLLAPVLHPPSIRVFDDQTSFAFANPAAVIGPAGHVAAVAYPLVVLPRLAAVIGPDGGVGGFSLLAEWRDPARPQPKDRDFALGLGPVVVTSDEPGAREAWGAFPGFDWQSAIALAAEGTTLLPGDVVASPAADPLRVEQGGDVELDIPGIGVLAATVGA
jgi:hypothetical protein